MAATLLVPPLVAASPPEALAQERTDSIRRILLPAPSGPHAVGLTRFELADHARPDTLEAGGPRRLVVWLWYPAQDDGLTVRRTYMDEPTAQALSESQGLPLGFEQAVEGHVLDEPPPARSEAAGWPLLLFSHGLAWPVSYYQTVLSDVASRGFVVAAVEHTHGADPVVFPSGEVVPWGLFASHESDIPESALWGYLPTWRDDLLFVLSALTRGEPPTELSRAVLATADPARAGAFGHSYGGTASVLAAEASPPLAGALNLEGASFAPDAPYAVSTPTLFVLGGVNAEGLAGSQFTAGSAPLHEATVRGATHGTFSDLMVLWRSYSRTMGPAGRIHPSRGVSVTGTLVVRYFEALFSGRPPADLPALLRMHDVGVVAAKSVPGATLRPPRAPSGA